MKYDAYFHGPIMVFVIQVVKSNVHRVDLLCKGAVPKVPRRFAWESASWS